MTGKTVDLKLPAKLDGLFKPCRYKVMYGGRGGGKSHGAASALLALGAQRPLRILCVREIQKSMRDTVHRLLKDKVAQLGLGHFYEITDFEIRGANGTLFVFSSIQSHTVDSIKSFEGIDIVWVEEGHGVSKKAGTCSRRPYAKKVRKFGLPSIPIWRRTKPTGVLSLCRPKTLGCAKSTGATIRGFPKH